MYQERILICIPAPIIGICLQVQFDNWGFEQIEHVVDIESAMKSVRSYSPSLLVMDADWLNRDESFRLIQLVRRDSKSIPIIFISKHTEQSIEGKEQLQWRTPYRWLSKPCHIENLCKR